MKLVTFFAWLARAVVFVALFAFAVRNTGPVTVRFYLGEEWQVPLVLALLAFFAGGVVLGVLSCLTRLFRQRREIHALRRQLGAQSRPADAAPPAPPPPAVI